MTPIFPGLESQEFDRGFQSAIASIGLLQELFDRHGIERMVTEQVQDDTVRVYEEIVNRYSQVAEQIATLGAYIRSFVTTDSRNDLAQARMSELQQHLVLFSKLSTRLTAWIGSLDVEALIEGSAVAKESAFPLRKTRIAATHLMHQEVEDMAAELNPTGGTAWSRLYGDVTSQLMVPIEIDGEPQELPMSVIRNMAHDPERDVRKRAYEAELAAWKRVEVPLAAALNSIKGETNTLARRRGWDSPLDATLFNNNIDRQTLDAMISAARSSLPDFRRYLRIKARSLGISQMTWYDIFAPVGRSHTVWNYDEAVAFLLEQFGTYSDRLRDFGARAIEEKWIDAEPRPGKVGGAFCMQVRPGESRVLSNYMASYDGVSTLAHELGHAYHNFNLRDRSILQRQTPMTLAETASIFCETIIEHAAIARADREEQIAILEASLQGRCQVVVDIISRFIFEMSVFEARVKRELSVHELSSLMLDAQRETYADALDANVLHPYMWAAKGHYYSSGRWFYNYPYMFGLLFGLGLYARYEKDPESFKAGYDRLLSSTGLADAATLASDFGFDIRTQEFWNASFAVILRDVDRFEILLS
jgi:pepF/M3 family oligoendopeptidase